MIKKNFLILVALLVITISLALFLSFFKEFLFSALDIYNDAPNKTSRNQFNCNFFKFASGESVNCDFSKKFNITTQFVVIAKEVYCDSEFCFLRYQRLLDDIPLEETVFLGEKESDNRSMIGVTFQNTESLDPKKDQVQGQGLDIKGFLAIFKEKVIKEKEVILFISNESVNVRGEKFKKLLSIRIFEPF